MQPTAINLVGHRRIERLAPPLARPPDCASKPITDDPERAARLLALFGTPQLGEVERSSLGKLAQVRSLAVDEPVWRCADRANSLVAVQEGEVALGRLDEAGPGSVERVLLGPAWLDAGDGWLGEPRAWDAWARTPALVVEWPCAGMSAQFERHPDLARRLLQALAREARALGSRAHDLLHKDAGSRLAQWLRQHFETLPDAAGSTTVTMRERKRDIAAQLSITPETLSRQLRLLAGQGLIEIAGYTVRVLDAAALERLAAA